MILNYLIRKIKKMLKALRPRNKEPVSYYSFMKAMEKAAKWASEGDLGLGGL
jgi:hypothetical protein